MYYWFYNDVLLYVYINVSVYYSKVLAEGVLYTVFHTNILESVRTEICTNVRITKYELSDIFEK